MRISRKVKKELETKNWFDLPPKLRKKFVNKQMKGIYNNKSTSRKSGQ